MRCQTFQTFEKNNETVLEIGILYPKEKNTLFLERDVG